MRLLAAAVAAHVTRFLPGKLRQFKGGAFTIARKSGVKIVPVTLIGNDVVFPANALMPLCPGRGIMKMVRGSARCLPSCCLQGPWQVVHPAINPEGKTDEELMEETRVAIASALPAEKVAS